MIKKFNYLFQALLIYLFFFIGYILRKKISRKLFSFVFSHIGPLFRSNKIIKKNIEIVSHKIPYIDQQKLISNMWKNYGMTFIEYIFLSYFRKSSSHITIKGKKNLDQNLHNKKPVIFVSGHFANFELMSIEITKLNINLATIYRPLNNFFLNPFMEYLRKKYICKNQIKKGVSGVREAIEFIKTKHSIALMIDQRVSEGELINFFDKPALTTTLPAQLSLKYDVDIVPVYIERYDDDKFNIEFMERISSKNFKDKIELSKELNRVLEKMIIKNPYQWIWTHNRWK